MKCALLSNVNVESLARRIQRHQAYLAPGFGVWTQELTDPASGTWASAPSAVFLILDGAALFHAQAGLEAALSDLEEHLAFVERAAERAPAIKFFVSNLDLPGQRLRPLKQEFLERRLEQEWHLRLVRATAARKNLYLLDLKRLVEDAGRLQFYSSKRWYLGGLRFSVAGERLIAAELERILDAQTLAGKKCLLLDLDNTLWGGVIGEDGLQGIQLAETGEGARYKDFQRRLAQMGEMGVILGVVSKNNPDDALEVFERHEHMVLKKERFAVLKIGWSPKPQSIVDAARELDIGLDALVYVDDNPVEREAVRTALPEVTVAAFPEDTSDLPAFAEQLYRDHFFALESTDEDRNRGRSYLAQAQRAAERNRAASVGDFLAALRTRIVLGPLREEDVARAAQLTQKTNQLNLTTRRYTEQEMAALRSAPGVAVAIGSVADKHGDSGKVFLGILRRISPDTAELDTFLMSCRVMGRFIEDQILDQLVKGLRGEGVSRLRLRLIPTRKNVPAQDFVERLAGGHLVCKDADGACWEFEIARTSPVTKPAYAELLTL